MDKLLAWKPLSFSVLGSLPDFFIDLNIFSPDFSYTVTQYFMTLALMAVRQEVNNFESSVVVQELQSFVVMQELDVAMNLALYGLS